MSCQINGLNVKAIKYGSQNITKVMQNGNTLWSSGRYIVGDNYGVVYSYSGGSSWEAFTPIPSGSVMGGAYGNGRLVTTGYSQPSTPISYSLADGSSSWTSLSYNNQGVNYLPGVSYGGGRFFAQGFWGWYATLVDGSNTWQCTQYSEDNTNMSYSAYSPTSSTGTLGVFIGVGETGRFSVYKRLSDGVMEYDYYTKEQMTIGGEAVESNFCGVAYGGGKFVAMDVIGAFYESESGGYSWGIGGSMGYSSTAQHSIDFGGGRFVAINGYRYSKYQEQGSSTWVSLPQLDVSVGSIYYAKDRFFAFGTEGSNKKVRVLRDGSTTWETMPDIPTASTIKFVTYMP